MDEIGLVHQGLVQRDAGLDAGNDHFLQRALQPHDAAFAGAARDDQLGDHRVIIRRDLVPGVKPGIDPHVHAAGRVIGADLAGRGREGPGIFGVDPALDRVALELDVLLGDRQRLAIGNADLLAHQVHAGDRFGNGVFHLQAGVHFDEIELAVFPQEFDRPGPAIAHVGHRLGHDAAHPVALFRADDRRGGLFQHLLVTALERAIALTQVNRVAVAIAEHLEFDVARIAEVLFDIDRGVAERGLGLAAGLLDQRFKLVRSVADLHPAPAAARGSLDDHRISGLLGNLARFGDVADRAVAAGDQRQA